MPRSIIDIESSRPIQRGRLLRRLLLLALLAVAVLAVALWLSRRAEGASLGARSQYSGQFQGKLAAGRNVGSFTLKETSCFVG